VPGSGAALAYDHPVHAERLPAALVQGLRDCFVAHTHGRVDREGTFHTEWSGDRSATQL
jgi:6-phosphogluconate dehydrogenase